MNRTHAELCRRIKYTFGNHALLERALTHRSKSGNNYERLEFLGDSILNFTISAELYNRYPDLTEGELTRLRASLVKKETLALLARGLGLGEAIALGGGELKSGGSDRDSILADSLEALFGAVYKDGGFEVARALILDSYAGALAQLDPRFIPKDPKTQLQEFLQKQALPVPTYNVLEVSGDPHNQIFVVECQVPGLARPALGEGSTRRTAEQRAATQALTQLCKQ